MSYLAEFNDFKNKSSLELIIDELPKIFNICAIQMLYNMGIS